MIPKKIHYVWLGKGEKSELTKKCIDSWKKYLKDYEIIEWNEDNFDINSNTYLKEAYENKKYAFASDYIRLKVLYEYGGIYMDTDVEVLKTFNDFLNLNAFTCLESNGYITTGIIGSKKKNKWIKDMLNEYTNLKFVKENGSFDLTTNVIRMSALTKEKYGLKSENIYQDLNDIVVYPNDYFSPKDWNTGKINITDNTHAIHHFSCSWYTKAEKKQIAKKKLYIEKYGNELGIKKYERYLKLVKVKRIILLPFRALINPKLAINKIRRKPNE